MARHLLILLSLSCLALSAEARDVECNRTQTCVKRTDCPAVDSLYTELQQEEDPDRKKTLVSDLKSKICNAKEQKFCCDCNCVKREECPAINELYTNFEQETDKDKKRSLLSDLKKKICSAKEKTFCCDVKASATRRPPRHTREHSCPGWKMANVARLAEVQSSSWEERPPRSESFPSPPSSG